jgi:hypothetical protein
MNETMICLCTSPSEPHLHRYRLPKENVPQKGDRIWFSSRSVMGGEYTIDGQVVGVDFIKDYNYVEVWLQVSDEVKSAYHKMNNGKISPPKNTWPHYR